MSVKEIAEKERPTDIVLLSNWCCYIQEKRKHQEKKLHKLRDLHLKDRTTDTFTPRNTKLFCIKFKNEHSAID